MCSTTPNSHHKHNQVHSQLSRRSGSKVSFQNPCILLAGLQILRVLGQIGPVQTKVGIWQLQKCYICIFIFHKDHFKTIPSFLRGLVQKLALKTHVFHVFDLCATFGPQVPGTNEVRGAQRTYIFKCAVLKCINCIFMRL